MKQYYIVNTFTTIYTHLVIKLVSLLLYYIHNVTVIYKSRILL